MEYSFIIPHKNNPELLGKCISSIPHFEGVEIIVVDDNSSSDFVDFANFPGKDDPYVRLFFTKEGRGAGYARNCGLKHAVGKWIIFADSDDFFEPGIKDAMDKFVDSDFDVVFFKNKSIMVPSGKPSSRGYELNRRVDIALSTGDNSLAILYSCPWQKFFKRDMLVSNSIYFNEVRWANDVVFMGRVAAAASLVKASDICIYCITESDNSIITNRSLESRLVRFDQECENVSILRHTRYRTEPSIYYWLFFTWFEVWKINRTKAFTILPRAVKTSGIKFVKEAIRAKFTK